MSYGTKHLESLKANRPDLYRELEAKGELKATEKEVDARAERWEIELADELKQDLDREFPDRKGYLNRVQALQEARSVVMREIVLVPPFDPETTTTGSVPTR